MLESVREQTNEFIQQVVLFKDMRRGQGQKLDVRDALRLSANLTMAVLPTLKRSGLSPADSASQCREAVVLMAVEVFKDVDVPYVPTLLEPLVIKLVTYFAETVVDILIEHIWDRLQGNKPTTIGSPGTIGQAGGAA